MRASKCTTTRLRSQLRDDAHTHRTYTSLQQPMRRSRGKCSCYSRLQVRTAGASPPGCRTSMHQNASSTTLSRQEWLPAQLNGSLMAPPVAVPTHAKCHHPAGPAPVLRATSAAAAAGPSTGGSRSTSSENIPRAVVVGGGPAGLAAAIGLARQAGFSVDVFDSRPHPAGDTQASREALLVALGPRGLLALCDLGISLSPAQSRTSSTSFSRSSSRSSSPVPADDDKSETRPGTPSSRSTSPITNLVGGRKPPTGLTMLQGMLVQGQHGRKRIETYTKPKQQGPSGDSSTLTMSILAEASGAGPSTRAAAASATPLPLTLTADTYTSATFDATGAAAAAAAPDTTPLSSVGAAAATSAEAAQAGTFPVVVRAPGTPEAGHTSMSHSVTSGQTSVGQSLTGSQSEDVGPGVRCHYGCDLLMVDTGNRQATFIGHDGEAQVMPYDMLIGAEHEGGALLVGEALADIHQRRHARRHPASSSSSNAVPPPAAAAAAAGGGGAAAAAQGEGQLQQQQQQPPDKLAALPAAAKAAAAAAGFVELEYQSWHDMPHQKELQALLPKSVHNMSNPMEEALGQPQHAGPGQGWLLVWTGSSGSGKAAPFPSTGDTGTSSATWTVSGTSGDTKKTSGSGSVLMPGGPSCTLMAWPSRGGGSWSGAVFTAPQVFESLRSQADYEGLLKGLGSSSGSALPGLWIKGIAAQLRGRGDRVGKVMAPCLPAPPHMTAPAAGLLLLSPSACMTGSPQLLCPTVAVGLQDAAELAAAVGAAVGKQGPAAAEDLHKRLQQALLHYDRLRQPQVAALQKLQAQLSYLRHSFSPAASAALATIPPFTLPWLTGLFGHARTGLALQWRSIVAVLPLIAAVTSAAKGLGFGHHASRAAAGSASGSPGSSSISGASPGPGGNAAAAAAAATATTAVVGLADVLDAVKPTGASFMAFLHTTAVPFTTLWHLLNAAPLLLAAVWAVGIWAAAEAVRWGVWAWQVWGVSWAGA